MILDNWRYILFTFTYHQSTEVAAILDGEVMNEANVGGRRRGGIRRHYSGKMKPKKTGVELILNSRRECATGK